MGRINQKSKNHVGVLRRIVEATNVNPVKKSSSPGLENIPNSFREIVELSPNHNSRARTEIEAVNEDAPIF